jgi:hypothetical protein
MFNKRETATASHNKAGWVTAAVQIADRKIDG